MKIAEIPFAVLRFQYQIARIPLQLIEDQIESCVLAMQNVRFDLLRLRSAGVAAVLDDLTQATQQARALSRDVDHAIAAAGEIREALGDRPRA